MKILSTSILTLLLFKSTLNLPVNRLSIEWGISRRYNFWKNPFARMITLRNKCITMLRRWTRGRKSSIFPSNTRYSPVRLHSSLSKRSLLMGNIKKSRPLVSLKQKSIINRSINSQCGSLRALRRKIRKRNNRRCSR